MLIDQIRNDIQNILTDKNGSPAVVPITFTTVGIDPTVTRICNGTAIKHNTGLNEFGMKISAATARVTVSESALIATGYPTRNSGNKLNIQNHLLSFIDSTGQLYNAVIRTTQSDETTGMIVCILGDYNQ